MDWDSGVGQFGQDSRVGIVGWDSGVWTDSRVGTVRWKMVWDSGVETVERGQFGGTVECNSSVGQWIGDSRVGIVVWDSGVRTVEWRQ